ncbi:TIGR02206 family membrane protein [Paenibacillus sp. EC2-1]|uniref:YwaF family protein n=1 Tax=Paenibacillus sp. EC2-1 TaxID=3388665 RepID=UPI003BEF18C1
MRALFDPNYPYEFKAFSIEHVLVIGLLFVMIMTLFFCRNMISSRPIVQSIIKWILIAALLLPEVCLQLWYFTSGIWDRTSSIPLELCSLTMFLSAIMLLTGSRKIYPLVYFAGIGGALQAVLTPSLDYPFPHFRFFHFFTVHLAIILAPLYMTWVRNYRPQWRSIGWTMIFLNVAALVVGLINFTLGSNYMYLMRKPSTPSLLDVLGPHPVYLLVEELFALVFFTVMYTLFFVIPDRIRKNRLSNRYPAKEQSY